MVFIALVFSENFTKTAVKCKQIAEKTNLLDICGSYGCVHWLQYEFWRSETVATAKKWQSFHSTTVKKVCIQSGLTKAKGIYNKDDPSGKYSHSGAAHSSWEFNIRDA